jgi:kinesin family protein 1
VFRDLGRGLLDNAMQGYNAALFAYGQTGAGKSFSMLGYGPNKGIIPLLCEKVSTCVRAQNIDDDAICVSYTIDSQVTSRVLQVAHV